MYQSCAKDRLPSHYHTTKLWAQMPMRRAKILGMQENLMPVVSSRHPLPTVVVMTKNILRNFQNLLRTRALGKMAKVVLWLGMLILNSVTAQPQF